MARAISSLPVPVSPTIRTQAREGATWRVVLATSRMAAPVPITPGSAISAEGRAARFEKRSVIMAISRRVLSSIGRGRRSEAGREPSREPSGVRGGASRRRTGLF